MASECAKSSASSEGSPHIGRALLDAGQSVGGVKKLPVPPRDDVARTVRFESDDCDVSGD